MNNLEKNQLIILKRLLELEHKSSGVNEIPYWGEDLSKLRLNRVNDKDYENEPLIKMKETDYVNTINHLIARGYLINSEKGMSKIYRCNPLSPGSIQLNGNQKHTYLVSESGFNYYKLLSCNPIIRYIKYNKEWIPIVISILALTISIFKI